MRNVVLTAKFLRAFRKFAKNNPKLQKRIQETILEMTQDVFAAHLGVHKLSGHLWGLMACSCGYDCRIIFSIAINPTTQEEVLTLVDIGKHDEVY